MLISNPSEKERIVVVNPAGTVDQKQILSREDDYVELRDDTLVPGRFLKNEKISSDGTTYRASGYLGVNVGGQTTFNIGRELIGLRNTNRADA
jgi:hypothetical protein